METSFSTDELLLMGSILDQLRVTVGYSAGGVVATLLGHEIAESNELFVVAAVGGTALFGSFITSNRPLQIMLFMVAAGCITNALPLTDEPSGHLAAPSVFLYMSCVTTCIYVARTFCESHGAYADAFAKGVTPFVVAFASLRCIRAFQARGHMRQLLYMSCGYIVLAPIVGGPTSKTTWLQCLMQMLDSLACQGLLMTLTQYGPLSSVANGLQLAAVYAMVLVAADAMGVSNIVPRAQFCKDTFCFSVAQELMGALQRMSSSQPLALAVFTTGLASLLYISPSQPCYRDICTVFVAGFSITFATSMQARLTQQVLCPMEQLVVYGVLFGLLQRASDSLAGHGCEHDGSSMDVQHHSAILLSAGLYE